MTEKNKIHKKDASCQAYPVAGCAPIPASSCAKPPGALCYPAAGCAPTPVMEAEGFLNKYEYWFAGLPGISGKKKIHIRALFPEAEELYRIKPGQLEKISWLAEKEQGVIITGQKTTEPELEKQREYCICNGIKLAVWQDKDYPRRLKHIYNPPYGIYYKGSLPPEKAFAVGVVGARNCSAYGRRAAQEIGFSLAKQGVSVISGMAAGIDGAGHQGALQAGGRTYGVLGCGVDVCYPAKHQNLYEAIPGKGGLLSEYPPKMKPLGFCFPQRNRIISGLSEAVIVVEAREKSGALITADFALEQGKEVYGVPGRLGDALSQGTNRLIGQGAGIFLSLEDFQKEMGIFTDFIEPAPRKEKLSLEKSERLVYSCLDLSPKNLDELMAETAFSFLELVEILESLTRKGCILEVYKNYFIRSEIFGFP